MGALVKVAMVEVGVVEAEAGDGDEFFGLVEIGGFDSNSKAGAGTEGRIRGPG